MFIISKGTLETMLPRPRAGRRSRRALSASLVVALAAAGGLLAPACSSTPAAPGSTSGGPAPDGGLDGGEDADAGPPQPVPRVPIRITGAVDTRFVTADHMFATVEMQLAGEPLAEAMGRVLTGYSRDFPTPNVYFTPGGSPTLDLPGFATAVESYEYSKQPMNNLALESGAGASLLFGPVVNPTGREGAAGLALLLARAQHFAVGSLAEPIFVKAVDGTDPKNRLGWPGLWPTIHPYRSFDPSIKPDSSVSDVCSISSDDDPNATGLILNLNYECDYNSLHLIDRAKQVDPTLTPGASGWAGWKYALWILNYLQTMHDSAQTPIATVPKGDLGKVGLPGNTVVGVSSVMGTTAVPGTYLGSSDIEGFQAQMMLEGLDNAAEQWLTQLTTTNGAKLSGFGSIEEALKYNYASPLRWFPGAIGVTEVADASGYPRPSAYAISDPGSHLFDLLGLVGSYASLYALTDHANTTVGGSPPALAFFDGDPFPADDQRADGEATLHDRALAMLRVLLVNIDRLHRDPASGLLVDDVTFSGATPARGTTIDTISVAYSVVGLRTMRRALGSQLQLYTNTTPDTATMGTPTVLDDPTLPLTGAPAGAKLVSDRLEALIGGEAQLLLENLTTADGQALAGWDVSKSAAATSDDTLDAHAAAIRGLLAAYLATGTTAYRDRAKAVFARMDATFYSPSGLLYTLTPGATSVVYTPKRFALVEGALRDMYELVGATPGQAALGALLEDRLQRLIKLVLNGWDDLNGDQLVQYPVDGGAGECLRLAGGEPIGGLQMGERALSGELGNVCDSIDPAMCSDAGTPPPRQYIRDREHDCVPEISAVGLPSALANQLTFTLGK